MIPKIYLRRGKEESLLRRHPWIFSGAIDHIEAEEESDFAEGALVEVYTRPGEFIAQGHYQVGSIAVRVLSFEREPIDQAWWNRRIAVAYDVRRTLSLTDNPATTCYRLVHGEGDSLPGLVVDKFSDVLVVQSLALGMDRYKSFILETLKELMAKDGISIRGIYERSDAKVREQEGMPRVKGFLSDPFDTKVEIVENGVRYFVDVAEGQKTGFFLDQKYNRKAIWPLCPGAEVLDCFTHTGSFALNAGLAGASHVLGVDASELGVAQARENAALNGLSDRVEFLCADVFELLPELEAKGQKFDLVILDPPAFTKSRASVKKAVTGYREINLRAMKLIRDGGFLATCSCSHFVDYELFTQTIGQAARNVHKRLRQVEYRTQAPDHPILWDAEDSYYLKFYIFQVCDEK